MKNKLVDERSGRGDGGHGGYDNCRSGYFVRRTETGDSGITNVPLASRRAESGSGQLRRPFSVVRGEGVSPDGTAAMLDRIAVPFVLAADRSERMTEYGLARTQTSQPSLEW